MSKAINDKLFVYYGPPASFDLKVQILCVQFGNTFQFMFGAHSTTVIQGVCNTFWLI